MEVIHITNKLSIEQMKSLDCNKKIQKLACLTWFTLAIVIIKAANRWSKIHNRTLRVPSSPIIVKSPRKWWQSIVHLKGLHEALRESVGWAKAYNDRDIAKLWSVRSPYSKLAHVISLQTRIVAQPSIILINDKREGNNSKIGQLQATCFAIWLTQFTYMIRTMTAS